MSAHLAEILRPTRRVREAGVKAEVVDAGPVVGAVGVDLTLALLTAGVSVAESAPLTAALVVVVTDGSAVGHHAARVRVARVGLYLAVLVHALEAVVAVGIDLIIMRHSTFHE